MKQLGGSSLFKATALMVGCVALISCSKGSDESPNKVGPPKAVAGEEDLVVEFGPYKVFGLGGMNNHLTSFYGKGTQELKVYLNALPAKVKRNEALDDKSNVPKSLKDQPPVSTSLVLAYPVKLLGEQNLFGGVITKVSDPNDPNLGMLKLLELTPLHVRPIVSGTDTQEPQLTLIGCAQKCSERSSSDPQLNIPILGVDPVNHLVLIDLSALGKKLNLISIFDPDGSQSELKPRSSVTSLLDYSSATLVFDVQSDMIPVNSGIDDPNAPVTKFTFRWYLKPSSGFDPAFVQRSSTKEVGFFMTERADQARITRWALSGTQQDTIHYFVKDVPDEFKEPFRLALVEWNEKMRPRFGRDFITFEFIDANDPRHPFITAGDVRYSVIEWDLHNAAPYGGYGPSTANQYTGEIFSANVLIQGPLIVELYKAWFKVAEEARNLRAQGRTSEADRMILDFRKNTERLTKVAKAKAKFGKHDLKIGSQLPSLFDPLFQRSDFDLLPEGYNYNSYMKGYFQEMVAHEIGHNLGLRHNFKGNLGDDHSGVEGKASSSVMEYLPRRHRHLNRVSEYDVMAMSYGYLGVTPIYSDWYCTDEDVVNPRNVLFANAECSRDDAGSDPVGYFGSRFDEALGYLINRGSPEAPEWTVMDMQRELAQSLMGLAYYGVGDITRWKNFAKPGRPTDPKQVRSYILGIIKANICSPEIEVEINRKPTPDAKAKVVENISTLRHAVGETLSFYGLYSNSELACNPAF